MKHGLKKIRFFDKNEDLDKRTDILQRKIDYVNENDNMNFRETMDQIMNSHRVKLGYELVENKEKEKDKKKAMFEEMLRNQSSKLSIAIFLIFLVNFFC